MLARACIRACMHMRAHARINARTCACACAYSCACERIHVHAHARTRMHYCECACMHCADQHICQRITCVRVHTLRSAYDSCFATHLLFTSPRYSRTASSSSCTAVRSLVQAFALLRLAFHVLMMPTPASRLFCNPMIHVFCNPDDSRFLQSDDANSCTFGCCMRKNQTHFRRNERAKWAK